MALMERRDTHVALCDGRYCARETCPKGRAWRRDREQTTTQSGGLPTPPDRERASDQRPAPKPQRPTRSEGQDAEIASEVRELRSEDQQGIPAGASETDQAGPVVRKRGRPVGARDSKPRKNAARVDDSMMPGRFTVPAETREEETKPEAETLAKFARSVLADEKVRKSLRDRFESGLFSPTELKALTAWAGSAPVEERPSQWKSIMEVATPQEIRMMANIARRAMGQAEAGILMPGSRVERTNAAILASGELSTQ
jgi:hypothetical protein